MSGMREIGSQAAVNVSLQPPEWLLDCRFVEENAAGLALGALDELERIRIGHHLSWCPMCAKLVHEMRKTVGYLPFTSPQVAPPASAKSRLFERIATESVTPQSTAGIPPRTLTIPASTAQLVSALMEPTTATDTPAPRTATPRSSRWGISWEAMIAPLAAVPLVLALAIVGGWALQTHNRLDDQVERSRDLQAANLSLRNQVDLLNSVIGGDRSYRLLAASDSSVGGAMGGKLTTAGDQGSWARLEVWNLPTTNDGYQVVLETNDGQLHDGGQFHVNQSGSAQLNLNIAGPISSYRMIHIRPASRTAPVTSDTFSAEDVLWVDMNGNLGAPSGTEANLNPTN